MRAVRPNENFLSRSTFASLTGGQSIKTGSGEHPSHQDRLPLQRLFGGKTQSPSFNCFGELTESADKKEQAESARASKKASEKRKKELIEKYGEEDGMLIFKRKISEKNYIKKKELIEKYGEKDGLAVFLKKVQKGMSLEMVEDVIGKHTYKDGNDYYFGNPFNRKIVFNKDKLVEDKTFEDKIWLDMPVKMLIASWGNPGDKKESVTKSSVKQRLFFNGRENRQGGTSYEYRVDIENDLVVGWKELE